ncbi:MAG: hypothetical protein LBO68_02280 [Synergistaceae bacterium]|jgi:hypothetical protein|nr:hypothetical protein [Synergistaceae bacterium]
MTTATLKRETNTETAEKAKARRNAEYLAMLERSFQQSEKGEVVSMSFEEWEEKFVNK